MAISEALGNLIGNFVSNAGSLASNIYNITQQKKINEQNIAFQKAENEIARAREDNAYQRAALDLERAGLSKTLAAGNSASSNLMTAPKAVAPQSEMSLSPMDFLDLVERQQNIELSKKNFDINKKYTESQIEKIKAETALSLTNSQYLSESLFLENENKKLQNQKAEVDIQIAHLEEAVKRGSQEAEIELSKAKAERERIQADIDRFSEPLKKVDAILNTIFGGVSKIGSGISLFSGLF